MNIKEYQPEPNGCLTPETRHRISEARDRLGLTWQEVGQRFGFSGGFARFLAIGTEQQGRVRTKHVERIISALEAMEAEAGIGGQPSRFHAEPEAIEVPARRSSRVTGELLSLEEIISQLHQYGFEVSLRPLQSK